MMSSKAVLALKGSRILCCLLPVVFFLVLNIPLLCLAQEKTEQGIDIGNIPFEVVAVLKANDLGAPLLFPSKVMFDPSMDETYVLSGDRIVVYGSDFYPFIALGKGRGAGGTTGMAIDRNGYLYLAQSQSEGKPPKVTIFNAAFFPVREIFFKGFKGALDYSPRCVAVSQDGLIYVASENVPGVLIMDQQGKPLRWLRPRIKSFPIAVRTGVVNVVGEDDEDSEGELAVEAEQNKDAEEARQDPDETLLGLPDELLPKQQAAPDKKKKRSYTEVNIVDIDIDQEGHLYLLSENASKIFVYSANEQFLFSFGVKGGSSGKLSRPRGLAVDEKKKCVYVVDYMRQTLLIYNLAGKFMQEFGGMGWSPGWFNYPTDVALNRDGNVIISDLYNQRVQVLDIQFHIRFPLFGTEQQSEEEKEKTDIGAIPVESKDEGSGKKQSADVEAGGGEQGKSLSPQEKAMSGANDRPKSGKKGLDADSSVVGPPSIQSKKPAASDIIEEPIGALLDD